MQNVSFHRIQYYIVVVLQKLVILLAIAVVFSACNTQTAPKGKTVDYFQTPPPDMVFVPGNGSVPSFYMGVTEESNLNYNLYLKWLETVYGKYAPIHEWAMPGDTLINDTVTTYNDPLYTQYHTHPAYANYPVVGVNWLQAMEYLQWKGDRLNEIILVENKLYTFNKMEHNQLDAFNTEAYLTGYWWGYALNDVKKPGPDLGGRNLNNFEFGTPYNASRRITINDGVLFTAMRLPTEAEWEYLLAQPPIQRDATPSVWKTATPFGAQYYLRHWDDTCHWGLYDLVIKNNIPAKQIGFFSDYTSIAQAAPQYNGITNLQGNADEWLLDYYSPEIAVPTANFPRYLTNNGFGRAPDNVVYSSDGYNSKGLELNFSEMQFICYSYYPTGKEMRSNQIGDAVHDDGVKEVIEYINFDSLLVNNLIKKDTVSGRYYYKGMLVSKNNEGYFIQYYVPDMQPKMYVARHTVAPRVVRANRAGGPVRLPMYETHSSMRVGFRAAMAHGGYPLVNRKYKVKWR
jgi:gliding motility-associated lipoprotein GldJ